LAEIFLSLFLSSSFYSSHFRSTRADNVDIPTSIVQAKHQQELRVHQKNGDGVTLDLAL
jgi:hypothetical protein